MGGQRGTSANRERLKELGDMIRICTSEIRRYKTVSEHRVSIVASYRLDIESIERKIGSVNVEYAEAPEKLISLRRQLDKFRSEQGKITGHVTGRTKLVEKYKKARDKLEKLEAELSDSGLDVDDIYAEPDDGETETPGDNADSSVSEYFQDKIT